MAAKNHTERAADPATPSKDLDKLAQHASAEVRKGVAGNPNASTWALYRLVDEFPAEVAANPQLPLLELSASGSNDFNLGRLLATLAARRMDPASLVEHSESAFVWVRLVAAQDGTTPSAALERLSRDPDPDVRSAVSANPSLPLAALIAMARDPNQFDAVMGELSMNPRLPPEDVEGMLNHPYDDARVQALANRQMPAHRLEQFASDPDDMTRAMVAQNPSTPPAVLLQLAKDKEAIVRSHLLRNAALPDDVMALLVRDKDKKVRAMAQRTQADRNQNED